MARLHSLRWRLMVALLVVFALGFGVSAIFSYGEAYGTLKELRKRTLQGQAGELLAALRFRTDGTVELALPVEWENAYRRLDRSLRIAFMTQIDVWWRSHPTLPPRFHWSARKGRTPCRFSDRSG